MGIVVAGRGVVEPPEDVAEDAEDAARVAHRESKPAQQQAQVVPVCRLHGARRAAGRLHRLLDHFGQPFQMNGWRGDGYGRRFLIFGGAGADGHLVKADGDGLAEVHRRLAWVGGNLDENVAEGEVFAGEAVLFRAEDEGDAAAAGKLPRHQRRQMGQSHHRLLRLAIGEGSSADDQGAMGDGLGKSR